MASDLQQFDRAAAHWQHLHNERAYSMPAGIGRTAIVCPYYSAGSWSLRSEKAPIPDHREIKELSKEALKIADLLVARQYEVEVILNAQAADITDTLQDPAISSIITVGHGTLSGLTIDENTEYDWLDVAQNSDHLKTGSFIQRHCGTFGRILSVPLGTFAVSDHRNVIAPLGVIFEPEGLLPEDNACLQPVSEMPQLSYRYIKQAFSYGP